jgi:hypothetical protein
MSWLLFGAVVALLAYVRTRITATPGSGGEPQKSIGPLAVIDRSGRIVYQAPSVPGSRTPYPSLFILTER